MGFGPPAASCTTSCRSVQLATFPRSAVLVRVKGKVLQLPATTQARPGCRGSCEPLARPCAPVSQRLSSASPSVSAPYTSSQSRPHSRQHATSAPSNEDLPEHRDTTRQAAGSWGRSGALRQLVAVLLGPSSLAAAWVPCAGAAEEQALSAEAQKVLQEMQVLLSPTPYSPDPTPLVIFAAILGATFWLTNYYTPGVIFRSPGEGDEDSESSEPQAPPRSPLPAYQRAAGFKTRSGGKAPSPKDSAGASGEGDGENKG